MYSTAAWTLPILSAVVILLATVAIDPLQKLTYGPPANTVGTQPTPVVNPKKEARLYFNPQQTILAPGKQEVLAINIDSGTSPVTGVEIHLSFNPKVVRVADITPGDFLQNPTTLSKKIENKAGKVVYTVGTLTPLPGKGTVARVKFSAVRPDTTKVSLDGTQVAVVGQSGNVVDSIGSATLKVQ